MFIPRGCPPTRSCARCYRTRWWIVERAIRRAEWERYSPEARSSGERRRSLVGEHEGQCVPLIMIHDFCLQVNRIMHSQQLQSDHDPKAASKASSDAYAFVPCVLSSNTTMGFCKPSSGKHEPLGLEDWKTTPNDGLSAECGNGLVTSSHPIPHSDTSIIPVSSHTMVRGGGPCHPGGPCHWVKLVQFLLDKEGSRAEVTRSTLLPVHEATGSTF